MPKKKRKRGRPKWQELEVQVNKLFSKAGFRASKKKVGTKTTSPEIDVFAIDKNNKKVRLLVECRDRKQPRPSEREIRATVSLANDKRVRAQKVIWVLRGKAPSDEALSLAKRLHVEFWDDEALTFYTALVGTLGEYAKYEIYRDLQLPQPKFGKDIELPAIKIRQTWLKKKKYSLYLFSIHPKDILKLAYVLRRTRMHVKSYQRLIQSKRLDSIAEFLKSTRAVLPTDIIVDFDKKPKFTSSKNVAGHRIGTLRIPSRYGSVAIIDGQHRIYGFTRTPKKQAGEFDLVAAGFYGLKFILKAKNME